MYIFSHNSKFLCVSFTLAFLLLPISKSSSEEFPRELQDFAKTLNCIPRKDAPFKWGVIKGVPTRDSAVFWCTTKEEAKWINLASFTLFIRPGAKVKHPCPSTIPERDVYDAFDVWEPGTTGHLKKISLDMLNYVDTGKPGKKTEMTDGYIIEASMNKRAIVIYLYCNRGRWMSSSAD